MTRPIKNHEAEKRRICREHWRVQEEMAIEASKTKMAKEHGLERNAKFEKVWGFAWGLGHSAGLSEVEGYFDDLVDLIKS